MQTVIHWFRRDLRISDNTALHEAERRGQRMVPVYVFDPAQLSRPDVGAASLAFGLKSLQSLHDNLAAAGHRLIIRHGSPQEELVRLAREVDASAVLANREYEPAWIAVDRHVASALYAAGIQFDLFKDRVIRETRDLLTGQGNPYTVFTPYSRAWRTHPIAAPLPRLGRAVQAVPETVQSEPLPMDPASLGHPCPHPIPPAGEHAGLEGLKRFLKGPVYRYDRARDFPAEESGTSQLSPHLNWGTLGIRTVMSRLQTARSEAPPGGERGCMVWETELLWREFYSQILANFPHVAERCFRPEYDALKWEGTEEQFQAWCDGRTGYPIVDAAMRCLNATGRMHNRLRMIVAMFLTKDLLVSWQRGERYFMHRLLDADLAANSGGWQWSAGCGTDAAPYFRIFNPAAQGLRFDPQGAFVRAWVPELRSLADEELHEPWCNPLRAAKTGYPRPIVDHGVQRRRCLAMFQAAKSSWVEAAA